MIIDAHTHIGRRHLPAERLANILSLAGIDKAAVFSDPESPVLIEDNQYVLSEARQRGWIPFYYIGGNAYRDTRPWPDIRLPDNLSDFAGIKWHCWFTPGHDTGYGNLVATDEASVFLDQPDLQSAMEAFADLELPVNFEEAYEITIQAVKRFPKVIFVIPHMGALNGGTARIIKALSSHSNVRFDTSLSVPSPSMINHLGHTRLISGSDYPYGNPAGNIIQIKSLGLSPENENAVLAGNFLDLLPPSWK